MKQIYFATTNKGKVHSVRDALSPYGISVIQADIELPEPRSDGSPRAFVNFALQTIGVEGILKLVKGNPAECEFRNCLAYYNGIGEPKLFESDVKGYLAKEAKGELREYAWSQLFLVFIPEGRKKTLAQMSEEEYLGWRREHHKNSFASKFGQWFSKRHD